MSLIKIRGKFEIQSEIDEMDIEEKHCGEPLSITIILKKNLRFPMVTVIITYIGLQMTGINVAVSLFSSLLKLGEIDALPYIRMGTGLTGIIATIVSIPLIDRVGRRNILIWPILVIMFSQCLFVVANVSNVTWLLYICVFFILASFGISYGVVCQVIAVEYFTQDARPIATSLANVTQNLFNLIALLSYVLSNTIQNYIFLVNAAISFIVFSYLYVFMHETKNMTFLQISTKLRKFNSSETYRSHKSVIASNE